jgi:hypothetical protein
VSLAKCVCVLKLLFPCMLLHRSRRLRKVVQTVHATHAFHGEAWHNFVAVSGEAVNAAGHKVTVELYAQLRLLLWWGDQQLACVRWLRDLVGRPAAGLGQVAGG